MLQRVQTVFLVLVVIFMGLSFFFPLWGLTDSEGVRVYEIFNLKLIKYSVGTGPTEELFLPYSFIATLAAASMMVAAIEITKFKNRLLQMKLGALNAMLMAATMGLSVYFAVDFMKSLSPSVAGQYGIGLFAPGAAMVCNVIANRFIRKDERLVKSVDRIR